LEAAKCTKSRCKYNVGVVPLKGRNLVPEKVHLGGSISTPIISLLLVDQSAPSFFTQWRQIVVHNTSFSGFWFVDPFWRCSRSKSKVVRNCDKFWTFFALPNFVGGSPSKVLPSVSRLPRELRNNVS